MSNKRSLSIQAFQSMVQESVLNEFNVEDFMKFLCKQSTLKITNEFLSRLDTCFQSKPPSRIVLMSFLISHYPDEFLSKERNETETLVLRSSEDIVPKLRNIEDLDSDTELKKVVFHIQQWVIIFKHYQKQDKEDLLQQLSKYHKEVRNFYQEEEFQDEQIKLLDKIEKLADTLGGEKGVEHVKTSSEFGMVDEMVLFAQLDKEMRNSFWDIFKKDMQHDPPNFKQYPNLIQTISEKMIEILPKVNKDQNTHIIQQHMNENMIQEKIINKTYTKQDIYNTIFFSLDRLKELHNSSSESYINYMIDCLNREMKENSNVHHEIPKYLRFIIEELEIIKAYRDIYKL